jgi:hypothetical protein
MRRMKIKIHTMVAIAKVKGDDDNFLGTSSL